MNCKKVILELTSYLDGVLDSSVRIDLEEHLARCTDCRIVVPLWMLVRMPTIDPSMVARSIEQPSATIASRAVHSFSRAPGRNRARV